MSDSEQAAVAESLTAAKEHAKRLEAAQESAVLNPESWAQVVALSLRYHREQRAFWRKLVNDLPAHLKEKLLAEDLGGHVESSVDIDERKPMTPHRAVRLPPPDKAALAKLTPTNTRAAAELRNSRAAAAGVDIPEDEPVTPEPSISVRQAIGTGAAGLISSSKDPLRSARASPAQLPQGGLNELQQALARRRGE